MSRVLRVKFELGLFEQPYVDVEAAAAAAGAAPRTARSRATLRRASVVLLKNERGVLPIAEDREGGRRDWRGRERSAAGRLQRARQRQGHRFLTGFERALGRTTTVRYAPGPGE